MNTIKNCSNCGRKNHCTTSLSGYGCVNHTRNTEKPWVYVASKLRGDIEANLAKAIHYTEIAIKSGVLPITPHVYFSTFLDDRIPENRRTGMEVGKEMLLKCEAVWVFGEISEGVQGEIDLALANGIPVYFINEEIQLPSNPVLSGIIGEVRYTSTCKAKNEEVYLIKDAAHEVTVAYGTKYYQVESSTRFSLKQLSSQELRFMEACLKRINCEIYEKLVHCSQLSQVIEEAI